MKTSHMRLLVLVIGFIATTSLWGQKLKPQHNPKYGADSISRMQCASNLSAMSEYVKIKVYDYAYDPWKECLQNCPGASKNIYIHGKKILVYKIGESKTDEEKLAYVDTLMQIYDLRIEHFGQEGTVLGKKGIDLLRYNRNAVEEAYGYLKKSLELNKTATDASVIATFATAGGALFKAGKIEADEVITNYMIAMEALNGGRQGAKTNKAIGSVEKTFAESGAASCDALIEIFTPKYEAGKTDVELLIKITELLKQTKCQESDLFANASESLFEIEPTASAGANLAMVFSSRKDYTKAVDYYNKAIELETDAERKAKYYYQLGAISFERKEFSNVRKFGYEAIKQKADYGEAYILIGNAYAAGSNQCGSTKFEKAASFLAAVDKFAKAKSVDPSVTEAANQLISKYSSYFPNNEDAFFEGFTDGKSYTLKCWINETTTIRTRKN